MKGQVFNQLHLHTLESLCCDLVAGHAIEYGNEGKLFELDENSRSVLNWYRVNVPKWSRNLQAPDVKAIVDSISIAPQVVNSHKITNINRTKKQLKLVKLEAHRFAGIHVYGLNSVAPSTYIFEPTKQISLFEGANGSGKTSLINAIVWCLTGELIRPQRPPEQGSNEFEFEIWRNDESCSFYSLPPVTPLPKTGIDASNITPDNIFVDTWVELTFEDENGEQLMPVRRALKRTVRGKIEEILPNFSHLSIDPIAFRIGTIMPALIPFIQIGKHSELGKAVAQLTGLSSLIDLANHAEKTRKKISGDLTKEANGNISRIEKDYNQLRDELSKKFTEFPSINPSVPIPIISQDENIGTQLISLKKHLEHCKVQSFIRIQAVLSDKFDPNDIQKCKEIESKISPALSKLDEIRDLSSASRLFRLEQLTSKEIAETIELIKKIDNEARQLAELAQHPKVAERKRLYARIAAWVKEVDTETTYIKNCPVCQSDLIDIKDLLTGELITKHLTDALEEDSVLLSKSIASWIQATLGMLARDLCATLKNELSLKLPNHPLELVKSALTTELFATAPFLGVLSSLKLNMQPLFDEVFGGIENLEVHHSKLPDIILKNGTELQAKIFQIERALAFSYWRKANGSKIKEIFNCIIGGKDDASKNVNVIDMPKQRIENKDLEILNVEMSIKLSLRKRLKSILEVTQSAMPINDSLEKIAGLEKQVQLYMVEIKKLKAYQDTSEALESISKLGDLAAQQVSDLQNRLQDSTYKWKNRVYHNAYVKSGYALKAARVAPEGALSISVGSNGVVAPAQHVANASALRASLFGFYIAFWEYVMKHHGGLQLMILDDPQELLDEENEARLADALFNLANENAQLFVTTHDQRFATKIANVGETIKILEHRSVHPVNFERHTLQTPLSFGSLKNKKNEYEKDKDNQITAQDYLAECRVFIESRLADLFDEPAYATNKYKPTLGDYVNQMRSLIKQYPNDELFCGLAVKQFCNDPALVENSPCLKLLNKAHHRDKRDIFPSDVHLINDDLDRLIKYSENLHAEFRRWRRREPLDTNPSISKVIQLIPIQKPNFKVTIYSDLAAFTNQIPELQSQDAEQDFFDGNWFTSKALFYLKNDVLGFSAPAGSILIVEIDGEPPNDHNLVIAKYKGKFLARRLLRDKPDSLYVTLATVYADPRIRPPSIVVSANEVELYRIVGVLFDDIVTNVHKQHDVSQINSTNIFKKIRTCHRVKDHSAVPLALDKQLVLGGDEIPLDELPKQHGKYVALSFKSGGGVLKKAGKALSGNLKYLCQFESIGGQGSSEIVAIGEPPFMNEHFPIAITARPILGVIYENNIVF